MKKTTLSPRLFLPLVLVFFALSLMAQQPAINNFRTYDQDGVNVFETPKDNDAIFTGIKVRLGGNFTQQFQGLSHENKPFSDTAGVVNALYDLAPGFNLATANLNVDVQLADGVRLSLVTYLSARHHPEAWVKGGYIQFDKLPFFKSEIVDQLMEKITIKIGHMEVNYADAHFRRTDNGNAIYNPFVGNYIVDEFNTEIGGEIYYQDNGVIAMFGMTGGEINGNIADLDPANVGSTETDNKLARSPSFIGKLGYDKQLNDDFRLRVTGSGYYTASSATNHIMDGDRGGARYYLVMSAPGAKPDADFRTGRYNPGFSDQVAALTGSVFMKYQGLELFGFYENASGRKSSEVEARNMSNYAVDLLYRIGAEEKVFVGGRYNSVTAETVAGGSTVSVNRYQLGAGWFITKNILAKVEYVNQEYVDFPAASLFAEGKFNGVMFEATVGF